MTTAPNSETPRTDAFTADDSQFTSEVGSRERAAFALMRQLERELNWLLGALQERSDEYPNQPAQAFTVLKLYKERFGGK